MQRFATLGRFLVTPSSGRTALKVGLPLYFAIGIVATVIFAPSGLDASTVVARAEHSVAARFLMLFAWCVATAPVMRAILKTETNLFLRALPLRRWQLLVWLGALMLAAELPWAVLWTRGGGVMSGLGATFAALALHTGLAVPPRPWPVASFLLGACVTWLAPRPTDYAAAQVFALLRIGYGATAFAQTLSRAWQLAPEFPTGRSTRLVGGSPALALAMTHALVLVRAHRAALARAVFVIAITLAWTTLATLNDASLRSGPYGALRMAMSGWIPSCIFASATVLGPMLRTDGAVDWVLSACGTTASQRRAATVGPVAGAGGAVGFLAGATTAVVLDAVGGPDVVAMPALGVSGAILAALTALVARWTARDQGLDAARLVLALGALIALAEGLLWMLPLG